MLMTPSQLGRTLTAAANLIESLAGTPPCRAFRPHAGWRGGQMYEGMRQLDYRLIGFGWMLWDFNWFRARNADSTFRESRRACPTATSSSCTTATSPLRRAISVTQSRPLVA